MPQHPQHTSVYISFQAVAWAMGSDLTGLPRLALIELARHADAGGRCWPSMRTIAKRLGTSVRWARSTIAKLERDGYISRAQIAGKGAIFQLHMTIEAPFSTPEPQFRGQEETPEPQFRPPRNSSSGAPRNPSSAKQRALPQQKHGNIPNRNSGNSRAGSDRKKIRNEKRYNNVVAFQTLSRLWNRNDMGPLSASKRTQATQKAAICERAEVLLERMTMKQLEQHVQAIIEENSDGEFYLALDACLDELIHSRRNGRG